MALLVHLSPVLDAQHTHGDALILYVANQTPVTHAVLPELAQLVPREGLSDATGDVQRAPPLTQEPNQSHLDGFVELAPFFERVCVDLNRSSVWLG